MIAWRAQKGGNESILFVIFIFGITRTFHFVWFVDQFMMCRAEWYIIATNRAKKKQAGAQKSTGNLRSVIWNEWDHRMEKHAAFGVNCWNIYRSWSKWERSKRAMNSIQQTHRFRHFFSSSPEWIHETIRWNVSNGWQVLRKTRAKNSIRDTYTCK